jgi:hypothetical protein
MIVRKQVGEVAGARLPDVDRAHWSAFSWVEAGTGWEEAPELRAFLDDVASDGTVLLAHDTVALVETGDAVAAIDLALDLVARASAGGTWAKGGVHVGRVKSAEEPVASHASLVAAGAVDLADHGQTLVTGSVLVELGDAAFDRYARGTPFSAELDGETISLYPFAAR